MDASTLYRQEAARRGHAPAPGKEPVLLKDLARRAGLTLRAVLYQCQIGALRARKIPWRGRRWQWAIESAEADRWLRNYEKHARVRSGSRAGRARHSPSPDGER